MPIHTTDQHTLFDHFPAQDEAARDEALRAAIAAALARHGASTEAS